MVYIAILSLIIVYMVDGNTNITEFVLTLISYRYQSVSKLLDNLLLLF